MSTATNVKRDLSAIKDPAKAAVFQRFFKTAEGQYGAGDKFIGISVPDQRRIAHKHVAMAFPEVAALLKSPIHEYRFTALEILVEKFERATEKERKAIANFYLKNRAGINNWDLVDTSAAYILGAYLLGKTNPKEREVLYKLARSKNLWDKRIAIISTHAFIRVHQFDDTFAIAELLMSDTHDLIHKAVGWMLREAGNRSLADEEAFLEEHAAHMPRTMLRYAIEKFPPHRRKYFLEKKKVSNTN